MLNNPNIYMSREDVHHNLKLGFITYEEAMLILQKCKAKRKRKVKWNRKT